MVISPELQKLVPFCIECKHNDDFRSSHLFHPTALVSSFHRQVTEAASKDPFHREPLLVMRGKDRATYAALPLLASFTGGYNQLYPILTYVFPVACVTWPEWVGWIALPWDVFLARLAELSLEYAPAEVDEGVSDSGIRTITVDPTQVTGTLVLPKGVSVT